MDKLLLNPVSCFNLPVTVAGTTTTLTTTNAVEYAIGGRAYSKAAMTNAATPTTDAETGLAFTAISANQGSVYVFGANAAGALKAVQGDVEALDTQGNFIIAPEFPRAVDDFAPFCILIVKGGATLSGTWTLGTNNLSSVTGMTYTFVDIHSLPDRPIVS